MVKVIIGKDNWNRRNKSFKDLIKICLKFSLKLKKEISFTYEKNKSKNRILNSNVFVGEETDTQSQFVDKIYGMFHTHPFWTNNYNYLSTLTNFEDIRSFCSLCVEEAIVGITIELIAIIDISKVPNHYINFANDNREEYFTLFYIKNKINSKNVEKLILHEFGSIDNYRKTDDFYFKQNHLMINDLIQKRIIKIKKL